MTESTTATKPTKNRKPKDPMRMVRPLTVEIKSLGRTKQEDAENRKKVLSLSIMVQEMTNYMWMEWFSWHHSNGAYQKIREFQAAWIAYKKALSEIQLTVEESKGLTKKERNKIKADKVGGLTVPKLDLPIIPKELGKRIYHGITERWPSLHLKVVTLTMNRWTSLVGSKKAAKGDFPGWHAILLFRESVPSSIHPLPINFESPKNRDGNAKLMLPMSDQEHHRLFLNLERIYVGKRNKESVELECHIWDKGKSMSSRRATLKKLATGEYQMLGSQLFVKNGKIFASICFEIPRVPVKLGNGVAMVGPGRNKPLLMRFSGFSRNRWVLGDGRVVGEVRRRLMSQRMGRKSAYRESFTSNSRGHGRNRGIEKVTKLSRRWRDFVTTYNRNLAAAVVSECLRNGIGLIHLARPKKPSRFLSNAGNQSQFDATTWDWYGLEKRIRDKCNEYGVVVESRPEKPLRGIENRGSE